MYVCMYVGVCMRDYTWYSVIVFERMTVKKSCERRLVGYWRNRMVYLELSVANAHY